MGFGEKLNGYYRARYWVGPGQLRTVVDERGKAVRYRTKRDAAKAANDHEARARQGTGTVASAGTVVEPASVAVQVSTAPQAEITFSEYVNQWYEDQDLARSTMQNYKRHIEEHLLPEFGDRSLAEISRSDVTSWDKKERAVYKPASVKTWRSTLHLVFADAVDEGLLTANPAARRRGRGRRAGRSRNRSAEKVTTDSLGMLLIAERASLLSGRDDEFVAEITRGYTGMRWGESTGLEPEFCRPKTVRVEWQLYELDSGELHRCPPKDDSYRDIDSPEFLSALISDHIARTSPKPCRCHGLRYTFSGHGEANDMAPRSGVKLVDVARRAGVSVGTVSNALNRPETVREETRIKVEVAIAELGYVRGALPGETAAHPRRSGYATWVLQPAVTGWYPPKAPQEARPVPVLAEPWPGVPARGRGASDRAEACWVPIARGFTAQSSRHTHKAIMEELGTPPKLMDERLGHEDGSVQSRYSHVTPKMRRRLMGGLTAEWETSLRARRAMCPRSPVRVLDELLRALR
ncbi:LacI family DNA-binding transcriptional regulator [Streptomyces sp. UNOC14_S4]|uniref:LacI family DNA-binding transcriptional regulator n=1 Tax=Streptomyces sp. UNOC14_S4 TaxID=2872340 RepID=UPI001E558B4C|nr:site-specific integrase [Streptomyces sp. UNOC14_S4]MCC3770869.1 LacI family DNA-binding transcriptional regulator [Streptomyces sp. UNOC14_S4]